MTWVISGRAESTHVVLYFTLDGHLHRTKLIIACGTLSMASLISLKVCEVIV